ncbi:MAG: DUF4381 family protein [Verrucomicrobiota bacterium]
MIIFRPEMLGSKIIRSKSASAVLSAVLAFMLGAAAHLTAQTPEPADDIRGPKPLVEIPLPPKPNTALWLGVGGAVLALVIAGLLWRWHARRKRRQSPPQIALAALTQLEASREALAAEAFANRAAQTVRQYIADRFGLAAPRRSTEEFLRELAGAADTPLIGESEHLRTFLKACDLAKFAASDLDAPQRGDLIHAARGFVRTTATPPTHTKSRPLTP